MDYQPDSIVLIILLSSIVLINFGIEIYNAVRIFYSYLYRPNTNFKNKLSDDEKNYALRYVIGLGYKSLSTLISCGFIYYFIQIVREVKFLEFNIWLVGSWFISTYLGNTLDYIYFPFSERWIVKRWLSKFTLSNLNFPQKETVHKRKKKIIRFNFWSAAFSLVFMIYSMYLSGNFIFDIFFGSLFLPFLFILFYYFSIKRSLNRRRWT